MPLPLDNGDNSSLLAQTSFKEFLHAQISLFFDTNDSPETSRRTLWEAFKAFMRGQIISYVSSLKKAEKAESEAITKEIFTVELIICILQPPPLLFIKNVFNSSLNLIYYLQVKHRGSYFWLNNVFLRLGIKQGDY